MANLVELYDLVIQAQALNGVPLSHGHVYVYALGRTKLMDTWSDIDGESLNPNPVILDNAGQAHIYVSDDFDYTLVFTDEFDNEIFSVDKYLLSKGEHSHADVAVAPSEHIGVSSYHVGEVTVYVPYLTGEVGKVYEGIDPIVVNNDVNRISANHIPLGVQDPLYFVEDSETACIIGCSAQTEIPAELSGKWDEASDAVIANSAQWAEGTEYEAGSYIDIDGHTISVTGLSPLPADTASTGLVAQVSADITAMIPDTSDMATQTWVNEQGFLTAVPSEYVTENTLQSGLSSKLDSTAFSTISGNFLTAHQSLDGLMSADLLEISDNKITGYNGTAFAGQGGVTGDYELVAGSGVELVDDPDAHTTTINVTAQGGNPEVEQAVIDNSANWNEVSAIEKLYISGGMGSFSGALDSNYTTPSIIATPGGLTAGRDDLGQLQYNNSNGLSATGSQYNFGVNTNGIILSSYPLRLSADYNNILYSGISKAFFSVSKNGVCFSGQDNYGDYITKLGSGISASIVGYDGIAISSKAYNSQTGSLNGIKITWGPSLPSIRVSGQQSAVLDISYSGASYIDNYGNVKWKLETPNIYCWNGVNDTHNNMPILLASLPITAALARNGSFLSANNAGIEISYGPTSAPYLKLDAQSVKSYYPGRSADFGMSQGFKFATTAITAHVFDAGVVITGSNGTDVNIYNTATSARYTLTGSVQKREIEGDSATSAITAIAGSAIGGGVSQSAFDELKQSYDALSALFAQYSGQWLLPNEGEE